MKRAFILFIYIYLLSYINIFSQVWDALILQAEKGDLETIKLLADSYLNGSGSFGIDLRQGYKWTKRAAELGDGESQFNLSNLYFDGIGIEQDNKLGWFWLERSAKSMFPTGVFKFAFFNHCEKNYEQAYEWFKIANEKFNILESDYYLGIYHFLEIGVTKLPEVLDSKIHNLIKAEEYLRRCCANGKDLDGEAHSMLFDLYLLTSALENKELDQQTFQLLEYIVNDGLQQFPDKLKLHFQKGELYLKTGRINEARIVWDDLKQRGLNVETSESILAAAFGENIDYAIPKTNKTSPYTYALVIANENYKRVPSVPYAINDGTIFRKYLYTTLGVPEENIEYLEDASFNDIKYALSNIYQKCKVYKDQASVIVYYAGHGIPDNNTAKAFLLPVDGFGADPSSGFKLDDFYTALTAINAKLIVVILDACFSGTKRDGGMLMATRGITIKPKIRVPDGRLIVLSATSNDESAYPIENQKHGLFTHTLLRKIQETKGNITYGELADYVSETVKRKSIDLNGKLQTPSVSVSSSMKEIWRNISLR